MTAAFERRREPQRRDFVGQAEGDDASADREHVRVVMLPRQPRRIEIVTERGADAHHFVRRHLFALSAAAEDDATIGASGGDEPRDVDTDWRVVDRLLARGTAIVDGMSEPRQRLLQVLFESEAGVIRSNRDTHAAELYYTLFSRLTALGRRLQLKH